MKQLNTPRFFVYALSQALRHPRRPVVYLYCPECRMRLTANSTECPKCPKHSTEKHGHGTVKGNPEGPEVVQISAIPWWGSVGLIVIGIACWVVSDWLAITGMDEAGRALVYVPLGSLFGMSLRR